MNKNIIDLVALIKNEKLRDKIILSLLRDEVVEQKGNPETTPDIVKEFWKLAKELDEV